LRSKKKKGGRERRFRKRLLCLRGTGGRMQGGKFREKGEKKKGRTRLPKKWEKRKIL